MATVSIEDTDVSFDCPPHETILRSGLRHGLGMPYDCSVGTCGECKIQLVDGKLQDNGGPRPAGLTERDVARGRVLACQSVPDGDCTIGVHLEDRYARDIPPDYHSARLVSVESVSPEMMLCSFATQSSAAYLPGQYARLQIPGTSQWRAFSMANLPNEAGVWEFLIRVVPGGLASEYLFGSGRTGETFLMDAPYGNAYHRTGGRHVVCIAGGAGLAPTLAAARSAAIDPACESILFVYGGRNPADLCAERFLSTFDRPGLAVEYSSIVSGDCPEWNGPKGFVHEHLEGRLEALKEAADYYVAGPPAMVDAVLTTLATNAAIPHDRIFYDRFF